MSSPRVHLYEEPSEPLLDLRGIAGYLRERLPGFSIGIRESLLYPPAGDEPKSEEYALSWSRAKLRGTAAGADPMPGEIAYERKRLSDPGNRSFGLLYDAHYLLPLAREAIPQAERRLSEVHIVFTRQLVGTLDEDDRRFHARVAVLGQPSIISTTGLIEAPARAPDHYLLRTRLVSLGLSDPATLDREKAGGRFLRHGDARMTEALKGYALQAVVYQLTGEAFCLDGSCRFYNAHWQEEMIKAQLEGGQEFCPDHKQLLRELTTGCPRT